MDNPSKTKSVLVTGPTGFVGGSILASLIKLQPNFHIKALISDNRAEEFKTVYPDVEAVIGELSSTSLLTSTAASVDFVIHAASDNVDAVKAVIDGLASKSNTSIGNTPSCLISITGPRSLIDPSLPVTGIADPNTRPWSDVMDAEAILALSKDRPHAATDQAIIAYAIEKSVGAMLISPGQLWGRGKGHFKKESVGGVYYRAVTSRGRAFVVGDGSIAWLWVGVEDFCDAISLLVVESLNGEKKMGVNNGGYHFVQTGDVTLIERAEAISWRLKFGEVERVPVHVVTQIHPAGGLMFGCGATFRADKLRCLGWRPKQLDWKVLMEGEGGERA